MKSPEPKQPKRIKNPDLTTKPKRDPATKSRLPGCEGCTKFCRFNGAIADPDRYFPPDPYKCNSRYAPEKEFTVNVSKSILTGIGKAIAEKLGRTRVRDRGEQKKPPRASERAREVSGRNRP